MAGRYNKAIPFRDASYVPLETKTAARCGPPLRYAVRPGGLTALLFDLP